MKTSTILMFGAFGGCCPTLARLASFYSTNPGGGMPQAGVFIGIALFAILGAFIAVGFGARELKAAIVAGIAAPGLVTNIVNGAGAGATARAPAAVIAPSFFISAAHADDAPVVEVLPSFRGGDLLTLSATWEGPNPKGAQVDYRFVDANGTFLGGGGALVPGEGAVVVPVPVGATALAVGPEQTALPAQIDTAAITITTGTSLGGDLLWALGADRAYHIESVTVTYGP
ncbi:hypothetical protein AB3Y40_12880 [Yoonia sp. R2331]|uniref:hypothetical protein n=1 Tax=Yoonia sp. R2331 TaxID=3237238 RepID=UPI0034E3917A